MKQSAAGRERFAGLVFGLVALNLPSNVAAQDRNAPSGAVKVASLAMKTSLGEFRLGGPVVVSRQDIESPLARVRSPKFNEAPDMARGPDPEFTAVYLTPREYTGRPGLPAVPPAVVELPAVAAVEKAAVFVTASHQDLPVDSSPNTKVLPEPLKTTAPPEPPKTTALPAPKTAALSSPQSAPAESHPTKRPPVSAPPRAKAAKTLPQQAAPKTAEGAGARKFGPAEIGASRAFSRM